jgi:hypothetical protein
MFSQFHWAGRDYGHGEVELPGLGPIAGARVEAAEMIQQAGHFEAGLVPDLPGNRVVKPLAGPHIPGGQLPAAAGNVISRPLDEQQPAIVLHRSAND